MIFSLLIAIGIPLLVLYFIWSLEIYALSRWQTLLGACLWGMLAFVLALILQTELLQTQSVTFRSLSLYIAPVVEELLKSLFILFLLARMKLHYAVDGTAYGFAIGTGFAVCENLLYLTQTASTGLAFETTVARVFSVSLMHAYTTGVLGTMAGTTFHQSRQTRLRKLTLTGLLVVALHAGFNHFADRSQGTDLVIIGMSIGFTGTALIVYLIYRALNKQRMSIDEMLRGEAGVSAGERAASLNPQAISQAMDAHHELFNERRMGMIQRFVALQAQRAILRKTAARNQRPHYAETLKRQIAEVESQLGGLRGELGLYTLVWLRSVLPSEESELWEALGRDLNDDQPILNLLVTLGERQTVLTPDAIQTRKELLRGDRLFKGLADEELEDLALLLTAESYTEGDFVVQRGFVDNRLFIVAKGSLIASVADDDGSNETIISRYSVGESFGELAIVDLRPHPMTVKAVDAVELFFLSREDLLTLIFAKPTTGLELMRELADQIRQQMDLFLRMRQTNTVEHDGTLQMVDPIKGHFVQPVEVTVQGNSAEVHSARRPALEMIVRSHLH